MFVFFLSDLGCVGSVLVSAVVTAILLVLHVILTPRACLAAAVADRTAHAESAGLPGLAGVLVLAT